MVEAATVSQMSRVEAEIAFQTGRGAAEAIVSRTILAAAVTAFRIAPVAVAPGSFQVAVTVSPIALEVEEQASAGRIVQTMEATDSGLTGITEITTATATAGPGITRGTVTSPETAAAITISISITVSTFKAT